MVDILENKKLVNGEENIIDNYMNYNDYVNYYIEKDIEIIPVNLKMVDGKKQTRFPSSYKKTIFKKEDFKGYNGIAIRTGKSNKVTVIDIDDKSKVGEVLTKLDIQDIDDILYVKTRQGYHFYMVYDGMYKTMSNYHDKIDMRNDGGVIFAPGTMYYDEEGKEYKYDSGVDFKTFVNALSSGDGLIHIEETFINSNQSPAVSPPDSPKTVGEEYVLVEASQKQKLLNEKEFEKLKKTVMKLDIKRADDYDLWIKLGMALYNKGDTYNNETFDLWCTFSKQSKNKFNSFESMKKWASFEEKTDGLTISSIYHWYKVDNPDEKGELMRLALKEKNPFKFMYRSNMTYDKQLKIWNGIPNTTGVVELMNEELMRTKKNEYIQLRDDTHYLMTKKDAIDEYAMYIWIGVDDKPKNPFTLWLNNINRRNIIGLKFDPKMIEDEKYFNIYKGFQYNVTDDNDESKIADYLFHIKDVWGNGDEETSEYILNWFAHIYQKPWEKTQVAIIIPSKTQGNGKNLALKPHAEIMKSLYYSTAQIEEIVGNFNPSAEGRLLINLNECTWGGRKSQSGILKALVTEDTMTINNKNVKPYMIENYSNVVITSNDENPIEIDQSNRRYYVIEIKEEKLSQERINAILKTDNQTLFNFFMNRDISKFDPKQFKTTNKEKEIKEFSYDTDFMYWKKCLDENYIEMCGEGTSWENLVDKKYRILKTDIISSYEGQKYGFKKHMSSNMFWKNSRKIFPQMKLMNANKNSKPRCELYDIEHMKKDFNKFFENDFF
jgi:hypothetical protein